MKPKKFLLKFRRVLREVPDPKGHQFTVVSVKKELHVKKTWKTETVKEKGHLFCSIN
jgi:hypothetical protein